MLIVKWRLNNKKKKNYIWINEWTIWKRIRCNNFYRKINIESNGNKTVKSNCIVYKNLTEIPKNSVEFIALYISDRISLCLYVKCFNDKFLFSNIAILLFNAENENNKRRVKYKKILEELDLKVVQI